MPGGGVMSGEMNLTRRRFLQASAAGLTFMYLPGIGRLKASPFPMFDSKGESGRLCYNENPLGPSPLAQTAMQDAVPDANRYPDWFSSTLESDIAGYHGLDQGNICVGTGATEVIRLIADAFLTPGDEVVTAEPTYTQMANEAVENGAAAIYVPVDEYYQIDLDGILAAVTPRTTLISLVNPNNPLARCLDRIDMEAFMHAVPDGIVVVVDEAYHDYVGTASYESCIRYVTGGFPVIVVRTFSKAFGLAGARIGYSIASEEYTGQIGSSQLFGTVSNVSQAAATAALTDSQHVADTVSLNNQAKKILEEGFGTLGLHYIPSETNFMMFDTGTDAAWVAAELLSRGYRVRTGWGMPQHIRVSTGTLEEMTGFIAALDEILNQKRPAKGARRTYTFGINGAYPNPFRSQCAVKITTSGNERVMLAVYDSSGRRVRTLLNEGMPSGVHSIGWDGKDVHGRRVASGIYIVNLVQGEFAKSTKVTLIR
jgi:histidinol-phosphate aminotransferase